MKKFVKTIAVIIVLAIILCLFVTGCKQEAVQTKEVSLTYSQYTAGAETLPALQATLDAFMKANPNITVKYEAIGFEEYFQQMATRIAGGNPSDLFELNVENIYSYASRDQLYDVSNLISKTKFDTKSIYEGAFKAFSYKGKQYGMPPQFNTVVLFYNKDLFDRAGVAYPTKDWTWKDEVDAGLKIRALGEDIFGSFQPIQINEFYKVIVQNGGSFLSSDGKSYTINSPENVEALQWLADKVNKYKIMPTQEELAGSGDWDLFCAGRLGMMKTGPWAFARFTKDCSFNWDIQVEPGNKAKAAHFFSDGIVMPFNAKSPDESFQLMKYMCGSKEAAQIRIDMNWAIPALNDQSVLKGWLSKTPPTNRQAVFDSIQYAVLPPALANWSEIQTIFNTELDAVRDGKESSQQALDKLQTDISAKFPLK